jgi:hypothetical protein
MPQKTWTADEINAIARNFQTSCVLGAGAELDLFATMAGQPFTAADAAAKLRCDPRGITILLDALAALALLDKAGDRYTVPSTVADLLTHGKPGNQLAMVQHQANCMRRWINIAAIVKSGQVPPRKPSVRGEAADWGSFIEAMDNISGPMAPKLVADLQPLLFAHLLDVGGGSGTWTLAFLRANASARATIFDLPHVIPQARDRIASAGMSGRVTLVPGDFYTDPLPQGVDLAWVSAIVHQNSRQQNRDLFARVFAALCSGGQILIRDFIMDASRTAPVGGALFAVNMLSGTQQGGTYTFEELRDDLASAGFTDARLLRRDETMHSVLAARKG